MSEKVTKRIIFQPKYLNVLAVYLRSRKKNTNFQILEDGNYLFDSEGTQVNVFPVFDCIIKALPKAFPKDWVENKSGVAKRGSDEGVSLLSSLMLYFGLDGDQFLHLFTPYGQDTDVYGGNILAGDATPKDIAHNISDMICFHELAMDLHPEIPIFISKN